MSLELYLQRQGLTQEAMALRLGLSHSYVNQLINGRRRASPEVARRIEAVTGGEVTAAHLLGVGDTGGSAERSSNGSWMLRPDEAGDVKLPRRLLEEFGAEPGEPLRVGRSEEGLAVTFPFRTLRRIQAELKKRVPEGVSIVDEFIAEKRAEAARE